MAKQYYVERVVESSAPDLAQKCNDLVTLGYEIEAFLPISALVVDNKKKNWAIDIVCTK